MKDFIPRNRDFWAIFSTQGTAQKILVEEPSGTPMITHVGAIFTVILNRAKSFTPVWLFSPRWDIELLKSYVPTAEYVIPPKLSWFSRLRMILFAIWKFVIMYVTRDILSFSYDGVKYGDIVYDTYLALEKLATIRKIDVKILHIIYACIRRHENIRRVLSSDAFEAVLVAHQIGIGSGVMLRTALRYGYKGYLRAGHHQSTLQCFEKLDEVYDYEYKPFLQDVDAVIARLGPEFDRVYKSVFDKELSGKGTKDGLYAFSKDNKYYHDRDSFNQDYGLDSKKRNVFVMLHAFNDHPHSHFRWMIFKDYYDWFIETLRFAQKNDRVNWIFKQHPSIKFYTTKDVSFDSLFSDSPKNIVYISGNDQIDTRSLVYCADLVITCIGSAGFELPAMAGIPSVTAGDNFYTGLGFALEPKTKEQYFEILSNAHNIERLTPEQQKRAQAAYMYIYQFSRVSMPACPILSHEEEKDSNANTWYWGKVRNLYDTREEIIMNELRNYIAEVAKPKFKRLSSLERYQ